MECNKDEAKRATDIAEKKLSEKDYVGAKKFVHKAQNLYPQLDGLEQVSMMINVYIAAANKINGVREADWYGILGANPLANDEAVKRQYKNLALLLHPDKNKFKGAEGAFKLVSEAWSLLSDKVKRNAYDQKRKSNEVKTGMQKPTYQHKPPNQHKPASSNMNQNASHGVDPNANATSNKPAPSPAPGPGPGPAPVNSSKQRKGGTFWTLCSGCESRFEFLRDRYVNKALRCPNCGQTFFATENNQWGNIMRHVDFRLSLRRQQQQQQQQQRSAQNTSGATYYPSSSPHQQQWSAQNTSGATYHSSSSGSFHRNYSASVPASSNMGNAANQAQESFKRSFEKSQETRAAAEKLLKKLRTDV